MEWASVLSVLRPCPVTQARIRADSFAGTSTTCSPAPGSRNTKCLPMPSQPPAAHTRSRHFAAWASIAPEPAGSVPKRPPPSTCSSGPIASIVADRLCGSIPITTWLMLSMRFSCLH
jgi:hypothetical protein